MNVCFVLILSLTASICDGVYWFPTNMLFSCPVMSNSLWLHELQHAKSPCPSPSPEVFQVHVHCIYDVLQPSHPLMPSSPSALHLSQNQGLLQRVSYLHQMTKILELQFQHQSFQWPMTIQGWFPLRLTGLISLLSKGLSGVFSTSICF